MRQSNKRHKVPFREPLSDKMPLGDTNAASGPNPTEAGVTSLVQARLVNDPFSDPALFVDFHFARRALLFDLGDLRARQAFRRRELPPPPLASGSVLEEDEFQIESLILDHGTPCLDFAFQEKLRINVWRE